MIVPESCIPLLKEHRTHLQGDFVESYIQGLYDTYQSFKSYLPDDGVILDIGCGMGGIDVLLDQHYGGAEITLLDKHGVSPKINAGFHQAPDTFAHYHDFGLAMEMMRANNVDRVTTVDMLRDAFPRRKFSVVISLLSWGFHYPISTYSPRVKRGGVIIADIRNGTDGIESLARYGAVTIVHTSKKYTRVVVKC